MPRSDTYTHLRRPPSAVLEQVARLYRAHNHADLTDQANRDGGVHFSRSEQWFDEQMSLDGAHLIARTDRWGTVVCYALFFTNPDTFPPFAGDCRKFTAIKGLEKSAYMYLILTDSSYRGRGLGRDTYEMALEVCRQKGCAGILHEYYVAPVPNHASAHLLESLERRGFPFTYFGCTTTHERAGTSGSNEAIIYQQAFVSAHHGKRLLGTLQDGFRLQDVMCLHDSINVDMPKVAEVDKRRLTALLEGYKFELN